MDALPRLPRAPPSAAALRAEADSLRAATVGMDERSAASQAELSAARDAEGSTASKAARAADAAEAKTAAAEASADAAAESMCAAVEAERVADEARRTAARDEKAAAADESKAAGARKHAQVTKEAAERAKAHRVEIEQRCDRDVSAARDAHARADEAEAAAARAEADAARAEARWAAALFKLDFALSAANRHDLAPAHREAPRHMPPHHMNDSAFVNICVVACTLRVISCAHFRVSRRRCARRTMATS